MAEGHLPAGAGDYLNLEKETRETESKEGGDMCCYDNIEIVNSKY